jgi:hypothetical protein
VSPPVPAPGSLGNDLVLGTPVYERVRADHDQEVARGARLRQLQARLPLEIHDSDLRVRDLAGRLGLDLGGGPPVAAVRRRAPSPKRGPDGYTQAERETLAVLPGTVAEVAAALGITGSTAGERLASLRRRGLVVKGEGYGAVWSPVARNGAG